MSEPPTPLLKAITIQGFLSFADDAAEFALTPLSVLIGPNGAGKSNLVEAVSVLRSVPRDLPRPIREGGRVRDWLWKPDPACAAGGSRDTARIEIVFAEGRVSQHRSGSGSTDAGSLVRTRPSGPLARRAHGPIICPRTSTTCRRASPCSREILS